MIGSSAASWLQRYAPITSRSAASASVIVGSAAGHDLGDQLGLALRAGVQAVADEQLPQHDDERVDVALLRRLAAQLLGRRVGELALERALARDVRGHRRLRDAEVEQARRAVGRDHHVLRRHVAMHDVERRADLVGRLVRGVQAGEHLTARSTPRRARGTCVLRLVRRAQQPVQRRAVDVLLDEHDLVAGRHDVEHRHDVAVMDLATRCAPRRGTSRRTRGSSANSGCRRLAATMRENPSSPMQARDVDRRHAATRDLAVQEVATDRDRLECLCRSSGSLLEELDRSCRRSRSRGS